MRAIAMALTCGAVALLVGCGGGGTAPRPTPATPGPATSAPPVADPCASADGSARRIVLRTPQGVHLTALVAGSGPRAVVLVPEAGSRGACGWSSYIGRLAGRGLQVIAFDHRCQGGSDCPQSTGTAQDPGLLVDIATAIARLRQDGADRIALLGASRGGSEALVVAARTPSVRAAAVLSADELDQRLAGPPGPTTARAAAGALRLPLLLAVAGGDPFVSVADTRQLFTAASTPAAHKVLVVLPAGSGHGWDLVGTDPAGAAFGARLASFLLEAVSS